MTRRAGMRIRIRRQRMPHAESYWQEFEYDGPADNTVAGVLDYLNYRDDITDAQGNHVPRISWECSCLQAVCGSCAMVINGRPALACETFLKDLKGDMITIEPLSKFPVISDLVVDRSIIEENLRDSDAYIREYEKSDRSDHLQQYTAAKCLKCGLCLEVCPNYVSGENFFGALYANDCFLISSMSAEKNGEIKRAYDRHFAAGCSKSLSCMDVCPMKIQTITSMARMNRR